MSDNLEEKRLDLELQIAKVKELELKRELAELEVESLARITELAEEQGSQLEQPNFPLPDFEAFYVEITSVENPFFDAEAPDLFVVRACGFDGVVGETWYRSSEDRAAALANWIVAHHNRCGGVVNRLHATSH